jgi:glucan phosphoethanolaminetransferase (alkaline phosphatase superfamily)
MIRWLKRKFSSLSFFVQKAYGKIITAKPSIFFMAVITIAASIFLLGGGVYDILMKPYWAIFQSSGSIIVFYPYDINSQFLMESMIIMFCYAMGLVGFILAYQSTKYAKKPRQAYILLLVGCVLVIMAYIFVENALLLRYTY